MNWAHTRCACPFSALTLNKIDPSFAPNDCIWPIITLIWNLMKKNSFCRVWSIRTAGHNAPWTACSLKRIFTTRSRFDVIRPFRTQTLFSRPWLSKYRFLASLKHDISGNIYLLKVYYTLFWSSRYGGFIDQKTFFDVICTLTCDVKRFTHF